MTTFNTSFANIERVYSGKPGCMCGCNGTYKTVSESPRSAKIHYNKVMNNPAVKIDSGIGCAYVTTDRKNTVIYFNK